MAENWIIVIGNAKTGISYTGNAKDIVVLGKASTGFKFFGPFDSAKNAQAWIGARQPLSVPSAIAVADTFASEADAIKATLSLPAGQMGAIKLLPPTAETLFG